MAAGKAQAAAGQTECIQCSTAVEAGLSICPCAEGFARENGGSECVCQSPDPPTWVCPCQLAVRPGMFVYMHMNVFVCSMYVCMMYVGI